MENWKRIIRIGAVAIIFVFLTYVTWGKIYNPETKKIACTSRCNVILIVEDALAASHIKTYGYTRDTMPETTAFFQKNGVIFEQATAPSPWTLPSFSSVYFSDLASNISYKDLEPGNRTNLQSLLRDTGAIDVRGIVPPKSNFIYDVIEKPFQEKELTYAYKGVFAIGTDMLLKLAENKKAFFLVIHGLKIHDPYEPKPPFDTQFGSSDQYSSVSMADLRGENLKPERVASTTDIFALRYDQGIRQEDASIAKFLASIPPDVLANTVIIFTSDHGEAFNEHGRYWHANGLYHEELNIPLMIRGPGLISRRVQEPVSLLDLAPTILSIMQAPIPDTLLGDSLVPTLFGGSLGERTIRFVNGFPSYLDLSPGKTPGRMNLTQTGREGTDEQLIIPTQFGVRQGDFKILTTGLHGQVQVFNLAKDPAEKNPLPIDSPAVPKSLISQLLHMIYPL